MTSDQISNLKLGAAVIGSLGLLYLLFGKKTDNSGGSEDPTGNGTYSPAAAFNAHNVADGLYAAMSGFGTDETAILEILKPVSQGQFVLVSQAFGLKQYNTWTGNTYGFGLNSLPLKKWLEYELSSSEYALLKRKYLNQL